MCIVNDPEMLKKEKAKTGRLMLWKMVERSNEIGIWSNSKCHDGKFRIGNNKAISFLAGYYDTIRTPGQFHGFPSRKLVRAYREKRVGMFDSNRFKIIKVYADRKNIMRAGKDEATKIYCISVSKMEIKSLKHQR